jgi:hypothetical protein
MSTSGLENSWLNSSTASGGGGGGVAGVATLNGLDGTIIITGDRFGGNDIAVTTNSTVAGKFINPVLVLLAGAGINVQRAVGGGQTSIINTATSSVRTINATAVPGLTVVPTGSANTGFAVQISPNITTATGSGLGLAPAGTAPNQSLEINTANLVGGNGLTNTTDGTNKVIGLPFLALRDLTDRPITTGVPSWANFFVNDTGNAGEVDISASFTPANCGQIMIMNTQGTAGTIFKVPANIPSLPVGWYCYLKVVNHTSANVVSDIGPSAVFGVGSQARSYTLVSGVVHMATKLTNSGASDYWGVF